MRAPDEPIGDPAGKPGREDQDARQGRQRQHDQRQPPQAVQRTYPSMYQISIMCITAMPNSSDCPAGTFWMRFVKKVA